MEMPNSGDHSPAHDQDPVATTTQSLQLPGSATDATNYTRGVQTLPVPTSAVPASGPCAPRTPVQIDASLGTLDLRTAKEEAEFQECEAAVLECWHSFVNMGLALAKIREGRLYKNEFSNFEEYCRARWGLQHTKVWALIAAATAFKALETVGGMPLPQCEAHMRPLIGLPPERAQEAWLKALSKTPDGRITAHLVKRAVETVMRTEQVASTDPKPTRQQRYERRRSIREGFEELIALLTTRAEHPLLLGKVQALQRLLEPLLTTQNKRA